MQNTITIPIEEYIELLEHKLYYRKKENWMSGIKELEEQIARLKSGEKLSKEIVEDTLNIIQQKDDLYRQANKKSQAYMEGYNADGNTASRDNPYPAGTAENHDWDQGWYNSAMGK